MKWKLKKQIILAISATMLLSAGGAVYVASNALPNGTMTNQGGTTYLTDSSGKTTPDGSKVDVAGVKIVERTTPEGKKADSDGGLILVNSELTAKEKSVILNIIAEEIRWKRPSYITHNCIDKSEFTLEHVHNAFYQFGSRYGIADYHDWVSDRKKANSIMTSFYGVNPNFENGKSYNWFEMNLNGVTNVDSGYKMLSVDDDKIEFWDFASGDTWSEADIVDYTYEDGDLIMKGLYTEDSNGGLVISDVPFTAKFKVNEMNSFRFALESIEY